MSSSASLEMLGRGDGVIPQIGQRFGKGYRQSRGSHPKEVPPMMAKTKTLGRMPLLVVILLIVITIGLYVPIWFIRVRHTLAPLKTTTKPARYLPYGFLVVFLVALATGVVPPEDWPLQVSAWSGHLHFIVWAIYLGLHIFLALNVVNILYEYSGDGLALNHTKAQVRAIILSIIYLQYEMNRIPAPPAEPPQESLPRATKAGLLV